MKTPFRHQREGAAYGINRAPGGFLFMGMRTGKVFTTFLSLTGSNSFPALILCPATVMAGWENDLIEEGESPEEILIFDERHKGNCAKLQNLLTVKKYKWIICNFEKAIALDVLHIRARWWHPGPAFIPKKGPVPVLELIDWRAVVVDESYRIANADSSITTYLNSHPRPAYQKRFCLSGSPASEAAYNLASQFIFVDGHFMGYRRVIDYMNAFYIWDGDLYKWIMKDTGHREEVRKYVQENAFCRTMQELGLGCARVFSSRIVQPNERQKALLNWVQTAVIYEDADGERKILEPMTALLFEQKIASGVHPITDEWISDSKINYVAAMVAERPEERLLIISRYTAPILRMAEVLTAAGRRVGIIRGPVKKRERERIRDLFQSGELTDVVAQVTTIKMGLDFSGLTAEVFLNNSFSQDDRTQAEDRGQHTLRNSPYGIIDICTAGFKCKQIANKMVKKQANARFFLELGKELKK